MNNFIKSITVLFFGTVQFAAAQQHNSVTKFSLTQLPVKVINEKISRTAFSGQDATLGIYTYLKGAVVPKHQHVNEQYSLITQGSAKVTIDGQVYIVKSGEGIFIPSNIAHQFEALEDNTIDIDFFAPARMDWIDGTDNYFQQAQAKVTTAFTTEDLQPVGITISPKNRRFVSFPNWLPAYKNAVAEVLADGSLRAYPDQDWNRWPEGKKNKTQFISVQNVLADKQNNLWVLDPATPKLGKAVIGGIKLVKINLDNDKVERTYTFPKDIAGENSFLNDVQIDEKHQMAYFSDPAQKALILLDLKTGLSKKVLQDHPSMKADPNFIFKISGLEMRDSKGKPFSSNVNGIALTRDNDWFYFRPETDIKLYRIATEYLSDFSLSDAGLAKNIQDMGDVGQSNGMISDSKGNIYLASAMEKSIKRVHPDGKIQILATGEEFQWPDTFALSPEEDYLLVSISQINRMSWFNNGKDLTIKPFKILKIKL
jgi:quercetin dioxygenase-like cupin family protein/sugar lactone lactonase YvrE